MLRAACGLDKLFIFAILVIVVRELVAMPRKGHRTDPVTASLKEPVATLSFPPTTKEQPCPIPTVPRNTAPGATTRPLATAAWAMRTRPARRPASRPCTPWTRRPTELRPPAVLAKV